MPGAHLQLVAKGAQDQLVTGNPSFTHFRAVYKRHTDFAMEHFRLFFKTSILSYPTSGTTKLRAKMDKYGQLLHDCYLSIDIPDIFSPVVQITGTPADTSKNSDALGYEFQWIKNLGYNMIRHVSVLINGQEIVRHTGEWMKLYADLTFDANKKAILDRMTGNVPELYDPANIGGRINQYPHAIAPNPDIDPNPSISGRTLLIPFHFWFCETVGHALPLVALQNSDVEIVVELRNMYDLFTVRDVRHTSATYGKRIVPDTSSNEFFSMSKFLSPSSYSLTPSVSNGAINTWNFNPFIEANYIFVNDTELAYLARTDHSFMIKQVDMTQAEGQYGPSNDLELVMKNLCTRLVWVCQRSDRVQLNDYDNYTNWEDPDSAPIITKGNTWNSGWYSSGKVLTENTGEKNILIESTLMLDGQERFATKQANFFNSLQLYRHQSGNPIDGVYGYSFSLDNDLVQPSGNINASMFGKIILRNTYLLPPLQESSADGTGFTSQCVLKSTVGSKVPVVVPNPNAVDSYGKKLYSSDDLITIIRKTGERDVYKYTFNVRAYVESYNFLRIVGGLGNIVFSS